MTIRSVTCHALRHLRRSRHRRMFVARCRLAPLLYAWFTCRATAGRLAAPGGRLPERRPTVATTPVETDEEKFVRVVLTMTAGCREASRRLDAMLADPGPVKA